MPEPSVSAASSQILDLLREDNPAILMVKMLLQRLDNVESQNSIIMRQTQRDLGFMQRSYNEQVRALESRIRDLEYALKMRHEVANLANLAEVADQMRSRDPNAQRREELAHRKRTEWAQFGVENPYRRT